MKKYTMSLTALVTFTAIVILGIYDLGAVTFGGTGSSVSSWLINVGYNAPLFVFALGACCGHLFWRMKPERKAKP